MFSWGNSKQEQKPGNKEEKKPESNHSPSGLNNLSELVPNDMKQYRDEIAAMCIKKCLNDFDEPDLSTGQRVCLKRCVNKFANTLEFSNRLCNFLEHKVNKFQQMQPPPENK